MKPNILTGKSIFGILSFILTPLAILFAATTTVIVEGIIVDPENTLIRAQLPEIIRAVVLTTLLIIMTGVVSGFIALVKRDQPRWLPIVGLLFTLLTVIIFHYGAIGSHGD